MSPLRRSSKQAGTTNIFFFLFSRSFRSEHSPLPDRHMHAAIQNAKLQRAPKHGQNTVIKTPLDSARRRLRAKTSQLTCEQGSPYDPTGVRHVPSHSDIAPRASWIVACQACRLSGFSGATQTPTPAVSRVHTVIDTAKLSRKLHSGAAMWICRDQAVAYSRTRIGALTFRETVSANLRTIRASLDELFVSASRVISIFALTLSVNLQIFPRIFFRAGQ